nr:immunoglobulin heavy chain junction region [Macaca mulatta]MOW99577.1 immunoglobulin heavy chain junction region [Macaca mulatta]MOX00057.1 immunoglobulin heavy chain junction region [Macaca mulatta]MOX00082.1 immunoglobulin heavy chain junction region [Macaca mulatta]MOX00990.1 immunoglobulin heavy chain junction region [Macaca mulatta]
CTIPPVVVVSPTSPSADFW